MRKQGSGHARPSLKAAHTEISLGMVCRWLSGQPIPRQDIAWMVDGKHIEQHRIWFSAPFDADARVACDWLTGTREFDTIREQAELILDGEYFYSFDRLNPQGDYVRNGGMWLVSPELRLLAYLVQDM